MSPIDPMVVDYDSQGRPLQPCRLCGGKANVIWISGRWRDMLAECLQCGAHTKYCDDDVKLAADLWNEGKYRRRKQSPGGVREGAKG